VEKKIMISISIDLQDGFSDDTVMVQVNGREIFSKSGVNTDYSIGRADSVQTMVPEGSVEIAVAVPSRSLSDKVVINAAAEVYVGVSIIDDRIVFRTSDEMYTYF
jgi:hypothetical protein